MNQKVLILGVLILAVVITLIILKQKKPKSTTARPVISVLFATKDVNTGQIVQAGDFEWRALSKNDVLSPDLIIQGTRRDKDLVGAKILMPLIANQPIKDNMIVVKGVLSPLASVLKPGMRAFTIDISAASALAGHVKPGDVVDIILTYKKTVANTRETLTVTETIIRNVHVIAVDDRILYTKFDEPKSSKTAQRGSSSTKQVTLELTSKQAERVATAKAIGTLSLSLTVPEAHYSIEAEGEQIEEQSGISLFHGERAEETGE